MPSKLRLKLFFVAVFLVALGLGFAFAPRAPKPTPASEQAAAPMPPVAPDSSAAPLPAPEKDPALDKEVDAFRAAPPVARVERFYESESRRVGEIDQDPDLTARRLAAMAKELNPAEIDWLKKAALDAKRPGDGRFFAAYLLAQASSPASTAALRDIAVSPLPNSKNQGLVELERQVRGQAIEGLGHQRGSAVARDGLLDVEQAQKDPFLQDRSHRALYEWQTGRKLEDQDKEALRKVTEKGPR